MNTALRWLAIVIIDSLDLAAYLAEAYSAWHHERDWRGTGGAITTKEGPSGPP